MGVAKSVLNGVVAAAACVALVGLVGTAWTGQKVVRQAQRLVRA